MPPSLFGFSYFSDKVSCFCPGPVLTYDPPIYASCIWDCRLMSPCPVCWLRWGLPNILPQFALTHCTLRISTSEVVGITGMCHHAWPEWGNCKGDRLILKRKCQGNQVVRLAWILLATLAKFTVTIRSKKKKCRAERFLKILQFG
jgi:hypothetical protein